MTPLGSEFRYILLDSRSKIPIETDWQNSKNYPSTDARLMMWVNRERGNLGIVCGPGRLRVLDCDKLEFADHLRPKMKGTYEVRTGSGGTHFYILSDYDTNHILVYNGERAGEYRAQRQQVVCAGSVHPNGKLYVVANKSPMLEFSREEIETLLKPYVQQLAPLTTDPNGQQDNSRSGVEFRAICRLIRLGRTKEEIYREMEAYAKWSGAPIAYRDLTYGKALRLVRENPNYRDPSELAPEHDDRFDESTKSVSEWLANGVPKIDWLVYPLLVSRGLHIWGGAAGSYKSYVAQHLAISVASGRDFLKHYPVRPGAVLYLDEEQGEAVLLSRLKFLIDGAKISPLPNNLFCSIFPGIRLDNLADLGPLTKFVEENNIRLVILDSAVRLMAGDENSASDVRKLFDNLKTQFLRKLDTAFVLLHHTAKINARTQDRLNALRGSGDFAASADVVMMFWSKKSSPGPNVAVVKHRHKDLADFNDFGIKVEKQDDCITGFEYVQYDPTKRLTELEQATEDLMDYLEKNRIAIFGPRDISGVVKSHSMRYRVLKALVEDEVLENPKKGVYQVVPGALEMDAEEVS